jgi:hypothetical protein
MTICAWCLKEQGIPPGSGSHGICRIHELKSYHESKRIKFLELLELVAREFMVEPLHKSWTQYLAIILCTIIISVSVVIFEARVERKNSLAENILEQVRTKALTIQERGAWGNFIKASVHRGEYFSIAYLATGCSKPIDMCKPYSVCGQ